MKRLFIILIVFLIGFPAWASPFDYRTSKNWTYVWHAHNESAFQHAYQKLHGGVEEYELPDRTRVDLLTDDYAIEFDFANKIYEGIGQALHYAVMTGKKPKLVIILDNKYKTEQMRYVERAKRVGKAYNIEIEFITEDILNLDENGLCPFVDCKCRRKH